MVLMPELEKGNRKRFRGIKKPTKRANRRSNDHVARQRDDCDRRECDMKRFLLTACFAAIAGTVSCPSDTGAAEKTFTLIYESVYPKGHMRLKWNEEFLDVVEDKSKGRIKIDRHYGEPAAQKEALSALSRGMIDMLVAYPTYYDGKVALGDWMQLPANFKEWAWQDWYDLAVVGRVGDIMDEVYMKMANAKYIFSCPAGPYNFQIAKKAKKIRKFEDFNGMKIRTAGGSASIAIKALGGSPVMTIGGEYYQAMQKGIVDAGLMTTYSLKQYRLWEVADQVVDPPLVGMSGTFVWMNLDTWKKLDPEVQKVIQDAARDRSMWEKWIKIYREEQDAPIEQEARQMGVEFFVLPPEEAQKMYKAGESVWDWWIEQCDKQGIGAQAREVKKLLLDRFYAK
jgi:TRAP-type transport system periplasmic protein